MTGVEQGSVPVTTGNIEVTGEVQEGQLVQDEFLEGNVAQGGPTRRTQAGYMAARKASKEAAAPVVEQNAKEAQAAKKKAQSKIPTVKGAKAFADKAKEVEEQMVARRAARAEAK